MLFVPCPYRSLLAGLLPTRCAVLGPGLAWSGIVLPQPGAEAFAVGAAKKPVDDLPLRCSRRRATSYS